MDMYSDTPAWPALPPPPMLQQSTPTLPPPALLAAPIPESTEVDAAAPQPTALNRLIEALMPARPVEAGGAQAQSSELKSLAAALCVAANPMPSAEDIPTRTPSPLCITEVPWDQFVTSLQDSKFLNEVVIQPRLILSRTRLVFPMGQVDIKAHAPWVTGVRNESLRWAQRILGHELPTSRTVENPVLVAQNSLPTMDTLGPVFVPDADSEEGDVKQTTDTLAELLLHGLSPARILGFDDWMRRQPIQLQAHSKRRVIASCVGVVSTIDSLTQCVLFLCFRDIPGLRI